MKYNKDWDILRVVAGSRAYGTNLLTSDTDEKGVCIPPMRMYFSPFNKFEQYECSEPDTVVYEIRKFFNLAANCNPNIIEMLYVDESDILFVNNIGLKLLSNRHLFLSKIAANSFTGYAKSQLTRLKNHKEWNENAPEKPDRKKLNLPENGKLISGDEVNKINSACGFKQQTKPNDSKLSIVIEKYGNVVADKWYQEQNYVFLLSLYHQYKNWKENRNSDRLQSEMNFGYDTKHAYHLIRLLRMGVEILEFGKVNVKRSDVNDLMDIRNGLWDYDRLIDEANVLDEKCKNLAKTSNIIPEKPDKEKIEELCINLIDLNLSSI